MGGIIQIFDPCCGKYAIGKEIQRNYLNIEVISKDIIYGNDFFKDYYAENQFQCIVMNPPFKDWDKFVQKAKYIANKVCVIGKMNFFGSHSRNITGLWKNLKSVYVFDRQISYEKPLREDRKVECGMLISGWFVWQKDYCGEPTIKIIDMQEHIAKKGK